MMMDFHELVDVWNLRIDGILHLGAHLAEEAPLYAGYDTDVVWVEANGQVLPKIEQVLQAFPRQRIVHALVYDKDGVELEFKVTNYDGMSSSILDFGTHPTFSPDTVFVDRITMTTTTVDTLVERHEISASGLVMDLQGCEGPAIRGGVKFLKQVDWVMTEVNTEEVYVGCTRIQELDALLGEFRRVATYIVPGQGWGDGLYRRVVRADA